MWPWVPAFPRNTREGMSGFYLIAARSSVPETPAKRFASGTPGSRLKTVL